MTVAASIRFVLVAIVLSSAAWVRAADSIVVFNEIHYHPVGNNHAREFVELYNQNTVDVDMSGWRLSGGIDFAFPEGTVITGQAMLVVAADPGLHAGALGPFTGQLDNGGETLRLRNRNDRIMDEIAYNDRGAWPVAADGSGATLSKLAPLSASDPSANWKASPQPGGTPGRENFPASGAPPPTASVPLLEFGALWRYNESGQDLGPAWAADAHATGDDWQSGAGPLGFETNPARLPVALGTTLTAPFDNSPFVLTHYFETEFTLTRAQVDSAQSLIVTHSIDDGAVFHLNGGVAGRFNMPSGVIEAGTLALGGREADLVGPAELLAGGLVAGVNRLSVEVHQSSFGNSDVVMGLELALIQLLPDRNALPKLRISEVAAAGGEDWWVELVNAGGTPVEVGGFVMAGSRGTAAEHLLQPVTLGAGDYLVLSAELLGFTPFEDERLYLYTPGRAGVLDAVVVKSHPLARQLGAPEGEFLSPSVLTPGALNSFAFRDEIVINEIMYHHRPHYAKDGDPPSLEFRTAVNFDATWRYNEAGADLGAGWAATAHPVGGDWQSGPGALGFETNPAALPVVLGTTLTRPGDNTPFVITYYFESDFQLSAEEAASHSAVRITHAIDDGAIFYLNGREVERFAMGEEAVSATTLATSGREAALNEFNLGTGSLVPGINRISVEVHQSSLGNSDVVMGLKLELLSEVPAVNPSVDYAPNDEEWIELHNRSEAEVDLGGWEFDEAVRYTFPAGTRLGSGEYLVVAKDGAALRAKFPAARILGDFSGRLSNQGERLRLLDSAGNPADEVHYHDDRPWPAFADGGGSSLELRNPHADNSVPEAWAASDNRATSQWQTYRFTATAKTPRFTAAVGGFHELRLGLLDRGEVLLDDVSVIEDPGGSPRELIQNGSFDRGTASAWRLLGTHQRSEVVAGDGSRALKVIATARMNYVHNLLETSLKSGGSLIPVRDGTEYQISFRAKWLGGSPQLRAELYYNKMAVLAILDQPATHGTPGALNSTFDSNLGPTFREVRHDPAVPDPSQPIIVTGRAADPDGVAGVELKYSVNGGAFQTVVMGRAGGPGEWRGQIPGQAAGRAVQFYLEASDAASTPRTSFYPAAGPDSRAMFRIQDGKASASRQNLRVIMTAGDSAAMHRFEDIMSNDRFGCTIIYNENEIFYDCGIRMRGSMWTRNAPADTGLNFKFPADRPFRGVHETITTRRRNVHEVIVKHVINHAGGLHDDYNDIIQLMHSTQNGVATRLSMARFGSTYLDGLPGGNGAAGSIFRLEGMVGHINTTDGTPEGKKLPQPVNWNASFDLADQGDDQEIYRNNMRRSNNFARDDYDSLIAMCKSFDLSGQALEDAVLETIEVDRWMRQFALMSLLGIGDSYTHGSPHNLLFYARPSDGIVESMPWDWDFLFSRPSNAPLWGNRNMSKVIARPVFTRLFHGHLLDLIKTTVNTRYLNPWLAHYGAVAGQSYTGFANNLQQRASFVLSQLPPELPFVISSNAGEDFATESSIVTLRGRGWVNVRELRIDGADGPLELQWLDGNRWEVIVPLGPGQNSFTLRALNHQGREVGNDSITITNTGSVVAATGLNLAIAELMYHPADSGGPEFIELVNTSEGNTIDLTGLRFVAGIDYTFSAGTQLAPGARVVVRQAQFGNDTRLANDGERLTLLDAGGAVIFDFRYRDQNPWPPSADGEGFSLVRSDHTPEADLDDPLSWRPSVAPGGTPGGSDGKSFGGESLLAYAIAGTGIAEHRGSSLVLSYRRRLAADGVALDWELSADLIDWEPAGDELRLDSRINHRDGTETLFFQTAGPLPFGGASEMFARLRANLR